MLTVLDQRAQGIEIDPDLAPPEVAYGMEPALQQTNAESDLDFFPLLVTHTRQGFLRDPIYGGNRNQVGWQVIGFPGPASLAEVHSGRYSTLDYFADNRVHPDRRPDMTIAEQARARRRLHHRRRGHRRDRRQGADRGRPARRRPGEGTVAHPRDLRWRRAGQRQPLQPVAGPAAEPAYGPHLGRRPGPVELFCPVPQMVGGGTVHWQGWLPRFTPEDFRLRSIAGDVPGTTLVDWPISYDELEPYYDKIEWAFGVSGQAGANAYEGPGAAGVPVPADATVAVRGEVPQGLCGLGWNSFPTPQAALSQPFNGRPPPSSARSPSSTAIPPAPGPARSTSSSPMPWRPGVTTCGRSATSGNSRSTSRPRSGPRSTPTPTGGTVEQEADVFILAGGAIESARLLLMSTSPGSRTGWPTAATWLDATSPSTSTRRRWVPSTTRSTPGPAAATSAPARSSSTTTTPRGFVSGGHIAAAGVGIPLPINWHLPGRPTWGAEAKKIDRELFNHSMAVAMVLHDMPQHENRVDLDPTVIDAWGLPGRPDHPDAHENDLTQGRFLVDRCGEILEAAGAKTVDRVYPDPDHRQLLAPARNHPDGRRPRYLGPGPQLPRARGR